MSVKNRFAGIDKTPFNIIADLKYFENLDPIIPPIKPP
jgi:hypothetical protein